MTPDLSVVALVFGKGVLMKRQRTFRRMVLAAVAGAGLLLLTSCVELLPLDAKILVTPTATGYAPLTVTFDASASTGLIVSRTWNFGDPASGVDNLSTLPQAEHTFEDDGTYTVTLLVETADGEQRFPVCWHTAVTKPCSGLATPIEQPS